MSNKFIVNASLLNRPHSGIARYLRNIYSNWPCNSNSPIPYFFDGKTISKTIPTFTENSSNAKLISLVKKILPNAYKLKHRIHSKKINSYIDQLKPKWYHEPNFIALNTKVPSFITIHDLTFLKFPETLPKDRLEWLHNSIEHSIRECQKVFTVSETVKTEISESFQIDPKKIAVTYNGVEEQFNSQNINILDSATYLSALNLKSKSFFLFVGNIEPRKNLDFLVRIYNKLSPSFRKKFPLVVVGSSFIYPKYAKKIIAKFPSLNILYLPNVSDQNLKYLYSNSLALIFPSLYEGFGIPILEAKAMNTQVIASKIPVFQELFSDCSHLIELDSEKQWKEKIESISEMEGKQDSGCKSPKIKLKYSWKKSAKIMSEVFSEYIDHLED